jgi:hypothetical protein
MIHGMRQEGIEGRRFPCDWDSANVTKVPGMNGQAGTPLDDNRDSGCGCGIEAVKCDDPAFFEGVFSASQAPQRPSCCFSSRSI